MTDQTETFPVLYLFPRTDMASFNPGKAMAHTAHAANAFTYDLNHRGKVVPGFQETPVWSLYQKWLMESSQGFGTTIVLWSTLEDTGRVLDAVRGSDHYSANWSVDPTYPYEMTAEAARLIPVEFDTAPRVPLENGNVLMFRREMTCAWLFGDKGDTTLKLLLDKFKLHP